MGLFSKKREKDEKDADLVGKGGAWDVQEDTAVAGDTQATVPSATAAGRFGAVQGRETQSAYSRHGLLGSRVLWLQPHASSLCSELQETQR